MSQKLIQLKDADNNELFPIHKSIILPAETNLNTIITPGIYELNGTYTNAPSSGSIKGTLLVFNDGTTSSTVINQVWFYASDGSFVAVRGCISGIWNAWLRPHGRFMTGATSSADGSKGSIGVNPPSSGYNTKYWRADGTWSVPPNTTYGTVSTSAAGLAPQRGGTVTKFLRDDATWNSPFYFPTTALASGTNLNNITTAGVYKLWAATGYTNAPANVPYGVLLVFQTNNSYIQVAIGVANDNHPFAIRSYANSKWYDWSYWKRDYVETVYSYQFDTTIPANAQKVSVTANLPSGATFIGWVGAASVGWVGVVYPANFQTTTTDVWAQTTSTSARNVRLCYLYKKVRSST